MTSVVNSVYFVAFRRKDRSGSISLKFVTEIDEREESVWPNMGLFVFLRHSCNRGSPRKLIFPSMHGSRDNALEVDISLRSEYAETGNSNRFMCDPDDRFPYLDMIRFSARPLPAEIDLQGGTRMFKGYNLWELVPDDRNYLEQLWRQQNFYFLGFGKPAG